ncbi:hypothetical protein SAMN06265374_2430 [Roseibium denhamense]|uniref:Uncharacterized protein n=1 Tax=Roseibium denhamense TaxID=76305 RepID=A0ABY1P213_9HYPH|nr:hypothetical protein SAMN06265374_2430 [Roseibium denhamense]
MSKHTLINRGLPIFLIWVAAPMPLWIMGGLIRIYG